MSDKDKPGLMAWLGFREPFDYSKARWLGPILSGGMITLVGSLFILAIASAVMLLGSTVFGDAPLTIGKSLGVGAVTVALIGAPFVIWRSVVAQKSVNVQEQGQITDRINKAVEGLGAEKMVKKFKDDWTEPNIEVRIGAIYALERILQDSARDHIQIMEILCAYILQNAQTKEVPLPEGEPTPQEWRTWASEDHDQPPEYPRLDVDVALKVIERRAEPRKQQERDQDYRLGLERAPLRKIILGYRDLTMADLSEAALQGANLGGAKLQGAHLWGAELQGADLGRAKLQGADLWGAELQGADLSHAHLQGADLSDAQLQGADLSGAELQGAELGGAELDGDTTLTAATLQDAAVRDVDYTEIPQIAEFLKDMFGDGSVTLPGGHGPGHESWPKHWPRFKLRSYQTDAGVLISRFGEEWRKWQADPDGYVPPAPPEQD